MVKVLSVQSISALAATGNVTVSGNAPLYTVTFGGALGFTNVNQIASSAGSITSATTTDGGIPPTAAQVLANLQTIPVLSGNEVQTLTLASNGAVLLSFNGVNATSVITMTTGTGGTTAAAIQTNLQTIPA